MRNTARKATAFLLTLIMVFSLVPAGVTADTEVRGPLELAQPRPHEIEIQLEMGQDTLSLQEICEAAGEEYTDDMAMYVSRPESVKFTDDWQTLTNLKSIPDGQTGYIQVYDWAAEEYAINVTILPPEGWNPPPELRRPHYISIQLEEGQDTLSLQEICEAAGEEYTADMAMYVDSPDSIEFTDNWQTLTNLTSIPNGQTGHITVYDWATNEYAIYVTLQPPKEKKVYHVTETGTFTQAEILDAAGVTEDKYDNYYLIKDNEEADYEAYLTVNVPGHTVTFLTTELPEEGCIYILSPNGDEPCPFKLKFVGDNDLSNANDGIFTYAIDTNTGTATVTGFVDGLSDSQKADITIPTAVTWPKNGGTTYTVTGIADRAFESESAIQTVTIDSPVFAIGNYAFYRCTNLKQVTQTAGGAGSKLTIGSHVFDAENYGDSRLEAFTSEAGIDRIGDKAFAFVDKLETFKAGDSQKTTIGTNAFQNCSGELLFDGGISNLGSYSFYNSYVSKITTTSIDYAWSSIGGSARIDLVLNVGNIANGTLTDSVLTGTLLKYASGFKNITVNLEKGVSSISADAFSTFSFNSYDSLTVNVNTEDNNASITVAEGAVPANQSKLQINFLMYRENVTGADTEPLPTLEMIGRVTYLDSGETDARLHDDVFWYELDDNNQAWITGIYNDAAADLTFTSANQGDVYDDQEELLSGVTLKVAGIKALSDEEKAPVQSIVFDHTGSFIVEEDALNEMEALEQLTVNKAGLSLPENAFKDCAALETVVLGSSRDQTGSITIPAGAFDGCSAMTAFTARFNMVTVEAGAFDGCSALVTVSFEGTGSQKIKKDAFADAKGIEVLRIDNSYDVEAGAFAVTNGVSFIQNNDAPLNDNLPAKIGAFTNYIFLENPWWINGNAFVGNNAPEKVYFANAGNKIQDGLVSAITNAGSNLTDVYIDSAREDVVLTDAGGKKTGDADKLDAANPNVRIHYRENEIYTGLFVDGVNGSDENDGMTRETPFKTFEKVKETLESKDDTAYEEYEEVPDTAMTGIVTRDCARVGAETTPGTFTDRIYADKLAMVLGTITVAEDTTWTSGDRKPITLMRDPEFTGVMVNVTGGLALDHIILDGNRMSVTAGGSIVSVGNGATLDIGDDAVLQNNAYPIAVWDGSKGQWLNGGAVFADHATVNVLEGSLIDNNLAMYGGGIHMYGGTLNMTGGTVSNNTAEARRYENNLPVQGNGGGVLLTDGAVMNLSGGTITQNHATKHEYNSIVIGINGSTGGGIQAGASYNDVNSNAQLFMTGGTVSNNTAHAEGGGICIQDSCTGTITGGQIIGNESQNDTGSSYGGGGIYVNAARSGSRNGLLKMNNVLITDNDAKYGGGIASCETVDLSLHMGNGAAIYGNTAPNEYDNDLYFTMRQSGTGSKAKLSPYMMNGAKYNWTHVVSEYDDSPFNNGEPASDDLIAYLDAGSTGDVKLKSNPSDTGVNAAVVIMDNKAKTRGGGIGSNGNIVIGDVPPTGDVTMTPVVSKTVFGRDMKENETFDFTVYLEESTNRYAGGYQTFTYTDTLLGHGSVTMGKDGVPKKINLPSHTVKDVTEEKLGEKVVMLIVEDTRSTDEVTADEGTYFALHFIIGQGMDEQGKSCYTAYLFKTEKGNVTRDEAGNPVFEYGEDSVPGYVPFLRRIREEITGDAGFVNRLLKRDVLADKKWVNYDGTTTPPKGAKVVFELYADETATGKTVELDGTPDENGEKKAWTAAWKDLDVYRKGPDGKPFKEKETDEDFARIIYSVKEKSVSVPAGSYTSTALTDPIGVGKDGETEIYNLQETGGLEVSKTVESILEADHAKEFSFTVTLNDKTISGTFGDMTFTNGVASFTLKDGETKKASGLPTGIGYTVDETADDAFTTTYTGRTGTIKTTVSKANVTNKRKTGDLEVSKTVVSDAAADLTKEFSFTVTLNDKTINGTFGGMTFTNGVASFTLKDGETKKATGLPTGITYTVEETAEDGFTVTSTGETGTISETASSAAFTNTRTDETGDLEVSKTVISNEETDRTKAFSFTVTLSDTTISGTYGDMTFTKGVAVFELKDGEKASATGLPTGITYTVTETSDAGFVTTQTGSTGTITETKAVAAFTNTRRTGSLEITKRVTVESVETTGTKADGVYNFTVTRDGKAVPGSPLTIRITNGRASTARLDGLMPGTYTVHEQTPGNGTVLTDGNNKTVEITEDAIATVQAVTFTNDFTAPPPETIDIEGEKTWVDNNNADGKRPDEIIINLYANGKLAARARVTAAKNWKWSFKGLRKLDDDGNEIVYTIDEEPVEDYTTVVNGYKVTNVYTPTGSLGIIKIWDDMDDLDGSRPESIDVTLLANGTVLYTVTLNETNNWSAFFDNLPEEENGTPVEYTWKEEHVPGYSAKLGTVASLTVLTNSHEPELTEVSVRKVWNDNNNLLGVRPDSLTVILYADGKPIRRLKLNAENKWTATVTDLPVTWKGEPITYSWSELEPPMYVLESTTVSDGVTTFTNAIWGRQDPPPDGPVKHPGKPYIEIPPYETALGLEVIVNHVGHCYD